MDIDNESVIVYIAHPIGGDVSNNIKKVESILKDLLYLRTIYWPIAPYLDACKYLDDNAPGDRDRAFAVNKKFFDTKFIDELWVYGDSPGVRTEIEWARQNGIEVKFV